MKQQNLWANNTTNQRNGASPRRWQEHTSKQDINQYKRLPSITQLQAFWSMTSTTYVGGMTVVTDARLSHKSKHVHQLGKGVDINQASKTADIIRLIITYPAN
jgi:hypothetical protein